MIFFFNWVIFRFLAMNFPGNYFTKSCLTGNDPHVSNRWIETHHVSVFPTQGNKSW